MSQGFITSFFGYCVVVVIVSALINWGNVPEPLMLTVMPLLRSSSLIGPLESKSLAPRGMRVNVRPVELTKSK